MAPAGRVQTAFLVIEHCNATLSGAAQTIPDQRFLSGMFIQINPAKGGKYKFSDQKGKLFLLCHIG
jgi:hypothetical protein